MFTVTSFNANGIRSAARKGFFAWLAERSPDVLCLQETKAQEHQLPPEALDLTEYRGTFVDAVKKGYSGVAIFAKRALVPVATTRGFGWPDVDAEGRFLMLDFGHLRIASVYVPWGTSGELRQAVKDDFLERFLGFLARLKGDGVPTIVCGDYNIAHREIDVFSANACRGVTGFLPHERAWFETLIAQTGWVDAMRVVDSAPKRFTWWSQRPGAYEKNWGWRIDYQLVTPQLAPAVRSAAIETAFKFSDHAPLTIVYDLPGAPA